MTTKLKVGRLSLVSITCHSFAFARVDYAPTTIYFSTLVEKDYMFFL